MKIKEKDIVRITWVDQTSYTTPTQAIGSICKGIGHTLGYFLEEDKEWLSIAMERMEGDLENQYRHVVTLPKVCILKIEILEKSQKEK